MLDGRPVGAGDMAVLVRSHNEAALIREALANRGIGSVSFSQDSVFHSREAQELECVLHAMMTPEDEPLLMAAVSTEMMGLDSLPSKRSPMMKRACPDFSNVSDNTGGHGWVTGPVMRCAGFSTGKSGSPAAGLARRGTARDQFAASGRTRQPGG